MIFGQSFIKRIRMSECYFFVRLSQDEECLRPGDASDLTFLEKLEDTVGGHAHFVTLV